MPHSEVAYLDFSPEQSKAITFASQTIADLGGPEAKGVALQARIFAHQLEQALSEDQRALLQRFNEGQLSALMNPANEPTNVFPLREIIERLGSLDTLALTSTSFDFTRSDCFAHGQGNAGKAVSVLQFEPNGGFSVRYNSYRFSLNERACSAAARAFDAFQKALDSARPLAFVLQPDSALLINNSRALHGRDMVQDNRRLLIRQFGYSPFAVPLVLAEDPLLVRG